MAKNMFDLDESLLQAKKDYNDELKKARALCIRGQYDRSLEIYNKILDEYYENEEALIGVLRVHSKDFREYDGIDIENDIHAIESLCPDTTNEDYINYLSKRKDNVSKTIESKKEIKLETVEKKDTINQVKEEETKKISKPKVKEKETKKTSKPKVKEKFKITREEAIKVLTEDFCLELLTSDVVKDFLKKNPKSDTFVIDNKYDNIVFEALDPLINSNVSKIVFKAFPPVNIDLDFLDEIESINEIETLIDESEWNQEFRCAFKGIIPKNIKCFEISGECKYIPIRYFNFIKLDSDVEFIFNDGIKEIGKEAFKSSDITK